MIVDYDQVVPAGHEETVNVYVKENCLSDDIYNFEYNGVYYNDASYGTVEVTYEDEIAKEGFGRVGRLPRVMTLQECADHVKKCFGIEHVTVYGDLQGMVENAAICPGSGKSMADEAVMAGADVYITGDIGHHDGIDMIARNMAVIDAGHYGIEKLFIPYMLEYLKRELPSLKVAGHPQISPAKVI